MRRGWYDGLFSSTLGVVEKSVNGVTVGYVVGFVEGNQFTRSLRKNMIFDTQEGAEKFLKKMEKKTRETPRPKFKVLLAGKTR